MENPIGLPLRLCSHGFTPLYPFLRAAYAVSFIEAAPIRLHGPKHPSIFSYRSIARKNISRVVGALQTPDQPRNVRCKRRSLGMFEPEALWKRPERPHKILFQALHEASSNVCWENTAWDCFPRLPNIVRCPSAVVRATIHSALPVPPPSVRSFCPFLSRVA